MTVDICVVHYNTFDKLIRLLRGTEPWPLEEAKLYIADNGSNDANRINLQALAWKDVDGDGQSYFERHNIEMVFNKNFGYAAACNQLAAMGTGDIIGLLNADVWFRQDDIAAVQKTFDENPNISILGVKQRDEQGIIRAGPIVWAPPGDILRHDYWNVSDPSDRYLRFLVPCATVSGSAYFVRRSVWEDLTNCPKFQEINPGAIGAFLATPHFFEETFCSMHAAHHGYEIWYDGRISIGHSWRASTGDSPILGEHFRTSSQLYKAACDHEGIRRETV